MKANVGVESLVVSGGPDVMLVSGGVVSGGVVETLKLLAAGELSRLPAASVARTSNVCGPSARAAAVKGDVHSLNPPPSTLQANVAPGSGDENENVGVLSSVGPDGPAVIVVSGAAVSTVKLLPAGELSRLPAASVARTSNLC